MKRKRGGEELIFQEKPVAALLVLKEIKEGAYQTLVAKRVNTTYAHTVKIMNELEHLRLIRSEQAGRMKFIKLTELGLEVVESLERIKRILRLCEVAREIDDLYEKEVKGKLRQEIRKERVQREADKLRRRLEEFFEGDPQLAVIARRLNTRLNEVLSEAIGLPPSPAAI